MNEDQRRRSLEEIAQAREADEALRILSPRLAEQREEVIREVLGRLRAGEAIDPTYAVQQWLRLYELESLETHFKRVIRKGKTAGERLEKARAAPRIDPGHDAILRHT